MNEDIQESKEGGDVMYQSRTELKSALRSISNIPMRDRARECSKIYNNA